MELLGLRRKKINLNKTGQSLLDHQEEIAEYHVLEFCLKFNLVVCRKGFIRDAESGGCTVCPKDTYSDTLDATSCTSCPEGTFTPPEIHGGYRDSASVCYGKKKQSSFIAFTYFVHFADNEHIM